jgi:hypothetical protein
MTFDTPDDLRGQLKVYLLPLLYYILFNLFYFHTNFLLFSLSSLSFLNGMHLEPGLLLLFPNKTNILRHRLGRPYRPRFPGMRQRLHPYKERSIPDFSPPRKILRGQSSPTRHPLNVLPPLDRISF